MPPVKQRCAKKRGSYCRKKTKVYHKNGCCSSGVKGNARINFESRGQPSQILWGPFLPTLINIAIQFPIMFMGIGFNVNPLVFLISIILAHLFVISVGVKEPHISNMLQAFGQAYIKTTNLYKVKGNTFAP